SRGSPSSLRTFPIDRLISIAYPSGEVRGLPKNKHGVTESPDVTPVPAADLNAPLEVAWRQDARRHAVHGGHNVAESRLTVDRWIARSLLRPRSGSGWQPG